MFEQKQLTNTLTYLSFSIATSALGFVAVMVMSRIFPPVQYGVIGIFFSFLYLAAPFISISCEGLISVNKTTLETERYKEFQQTCLGITYFCFTLLQLAFILFYLLGFLENWLFAVIPLFALIRFIAGMAGIEFVAEQRPFFFGIVTLLTSAVSLCLTVALANTFGAWAGTRIFALLFADLLFLCLRYKGRLSILVTPKINFGFRNQILAFGLPSLVAVPGAWALNEADKIIVGRLVGVHALGIYTAAAGLAAIMMTFNQSLTNALYPGMFRALASRKMSARLVIVRYLLRFLVLTIMFCLLVIAGYMLIGNLILPPRYTDARPIFIALMLTGIAVGFYRPFGLAADYFKMARLRSISVLIGGLICGTVGYLGVRLSGPIWAAWGIAIGYICSALILASCILRIEI